MNDFVTEIINSGISEQELIALEEKYQFVDFSHDDGLAIALYIIEYVKSNNLKDVGVRITNNRQIVVQILMNGKKEDSWLVRKQKTVELSEHSTLLTTLRYQQYPEIVDNPNYVIGGGGFPLINNGECTGAIIVSGLPHLADHQLIIKALDYFFNS